MAEPRQEERGLEIVQTGAPTAGPICLSALPPGVLPPPPPPPLIKTDDDGDQAGPVQPVLGSWDTFKGPSPDSNEKFCVLNHQRRLTLRRLAAAPSSSAYVQHSSFCCTGPSSSLGGAGRGTAYRAGARGRAPRTSAIRRPTTTRTISTSCGHRARRSRALLGGLGRSSPAITRGRTARMLNTRGGLVF